MDVQSIKCALPFCGSQEEQTECSRNLRITAVVLGAILLLIGAGTLTGVFPLGAIIGWACTSFGIVVLALGSCLRYLKENEEINSNKELERSGESSSFRNEEDTVNHCSSPPSNANIDVLAESEREFQQLISQAHKQLKERETQSELELKFANQYYDLCKKISELGKKITIGSDIPQLESVLEERLKEYHIEFESIKIKEKEIFQEKDVNSSYKKDVENEFKFVNVKLQSIKNLTYKKTM